MRNRRNFYRLLYVQPDAPLEIIRASFRVQMRELRQHPDLGGATAKAEILNEAYQILSDPERRAAYDKDLLQRYSRSVASTNERVPQSPLEKFCLFCKTPLTRRARPGGTCSTCSVPLPSKETEKPEHGSRRTLARVKRNGRMFYRTCWPQEPQEARMIDLSPKGVRFLCDEELSPGTVLKLSGPGFEASGVIVNLRTEEFEGRRMHAVGVSFLAVHFDSSTGSFISTAV